MSWIKVVAVNVIVTLIMLTVIEYSFRIYEEKISKNTFKINDPKAFRLTRPEPYKDSTFFSKDFIEESFKQPGGYFSPAGTRLVYPNNFNGIWFNYRKNLRVTTDQPEIYKSKILIFGGSTVQNSEVPDNFTIASILQSKITSKNILVENYGVSSVHSGQQLERLKRDINLSKSDIVIFYDGVNDVLQRAYYGNPNGWIVGEVGSAPKVVKIIRKYTEYSAILRYVDSNYVTKKFEYDENLVEIAVNAYKEEIDNARKYVESHGAKFIHFIQPTLFTKDKKNKYEKRLIESGLEDLKLVFDLTYPLIKDKLEKSIDLTRTFDNLEVSPYFDFCHINEIGNKYIADEFYKKIIKTYSN